MVSLEGGKFIAIEALLTSRFWTRGISDFTRILREGNVSECRFPVRVQYCDSESSLPILIPDVGDILTTKLMNRCYLITHAHLDHTLSLIMLSGSVPPRPTIAKHPQPPIPPSIPIDTALPPKGKGKAKNEAKAVVPVFGTKETLERLSSAYGGGLWPELGHWASWQVTERKQPEIKKEEGEGKTRSKKRKATVLVEKVEPATSACGVALTPYVRSYCCEMKLINRLAPSEIHRPLHPCLPMTTLTYPVAHGCTSHGLYESSAVFIRYDPAALSDEPEPDVGKGEGYREFLFFGDVESAYRKEGDEDVGTVGKEGAARMNRTIWEEAGRGWDVGRLAGIFVRYSASRIEVADDRLNALTTRTGRPH